MDTVEILEDLFFLKRGWLNANHFVYAGEKPVLIDTAYKADDWVTLALFSAKQSLEKLASLDVRQIFPGHGDPFEDVENALAKALSKIDRYLEEGEIVGKDLIKKILVYTLLMKKSVKEQDLFPHLMKTNWFRETVDLYFSGEYETIYQQTMDAFIRNKVVRIENGSVFTLVQP